MRSRTVLETTLSLEECRAFREERAIFATDVPSGRRCANQGKTEQKVASDVVDHQRPAMLPTFGLARIVAPHRRSTDNVVPTFRSLIHILQDLGV
jgi:hypothetical protein